MWVRVNSAHPSRRPGKPRACPWPDQQLKHCGHSDLRLVCFANARQECSICIDTRGGAQSETLKGHWRLRLVQALPVVLQLLLVMQVHFSQYTRDGSVCKPSIAVQTTTKRG